MGWMDDTMGMQQGLGAMAGQGIDQTPAGKAQRARQQRLASIPRIQPYNRTPVQPGGSMPVGAFGAGGGGRIKGDLNTYQGPPVRLGPPGTFQSSGGVDDETLSRATGWNALYGQKQGRMTPEQYAASQLPVAKPAPLDGSRNMIPAGSMGAYAGGYDSGGYDSGGLPPWVQPPSTNPNDDPRTKAALDIYRTGAREREEQLNQRMRDMGLGASGAKTQAIARQGREHGLGEAALLGTLGESNRAYGLDTARLDLARQGQGFNQNIAMKRLLADIDFRNQSLSGGGGYSMWNQLPAPRVG